MPIQVCSYDSEKLGALKSGIFKMKYGTAFRSLEVQEQYDVKYIDFKWAWNVC